MDLLEFLSFFHLLQALQCIDLVCEPKFRSIQKKTYNCLKLSYVNFQAKYRWRSLEIKSHLSCKLDYEVNHFCALSTTVNIHTEADMSWRLCFCFVKPTVTAISRLWVCLNIVAYFRPKSCFIWPCAFVDECSRWIWNALIKWKR